MENKFFNPEKPETPKTIFEDRRVLFLEDLTIDELEQLGIEVHEEEQAIVAQLQSVIDGITKARKKEELRETAFNDQLMAALRDISKAIYSEDKYLQFEERFGEDEDLWEKLLDEEEILENQLHIIEKRYWELDRKIEKAIRQKSQE